MNIVFLDRQTIGSDIDLSGFDRLGNVKIYGFTTESEVSARVSDADVLIVNKVPINENTIGNAKNLKLICVIATGTNNLDKKYLEKRNIAWRNVAGYSTESVTQHTFAMLFYLMEHLRYYDDYVKKGNYINDVSFTHFDKKFNQLFGKTVGIIGLGAIGRRVADIFQLFGTNVIYFSASGMAPQEGYNQVDFDTILRESDILSIHAPLNEYTENLINYSALSKMKRNAILLNLGRGPIINESDLVKALNENLIAAAGLDVLTIEPMSFDSPLLGVQDKEKLLITPHIGWAGLEARRNLMDIVLRQVDNFFNNRKIE